MSKPSPKSNIIQTLLISLVIWSALMIWKGANEQPPGPSDTLAASIQDKESKGQDASEDRAKLDQSLLEVVTHDNQKLLDQSIVTDSSKYTNYINDAEKNKKLSKDQADAKRLQIAVLEADAQLKAGIQRNESARMRNAYNTLKHYKKDFELTPLWTDVKVDVPDDSRFGTTEWTPQALYDKVFDTLDKANKTELVYGFLPGYQIIDFLVGITGHQPAISYALACFLLALLVRAVVYPLTEKQLRFSRQMMQLAPLTNEIRREYKDDQATQQQKVMEVYKEYGINPLAGCFPALIQMPLFLSVYQFMLHYQFSFARGTFLWINPTISHLTHGWTAPNLGETDYPLILLYGITMLISTLLAPISDPSQAKQQRLMTIGVTVTFTIFMFFSALPSAFVLYWTFTNLLSMAQSLRAYRRPVPPLEKVNAAGGGVHPQKGVGGKWMRMMEEMQKQAAEQAAASKDGKPSNGKPGSGQIISQGDVKTGTPAKHKPKKRK